MCVWDHQLIKACLAGFAAIVAFVAGRAPAQQSADEAALRAWLDSIPREPALDRVRDVVFELEQVHPSQMGEAELERLEREIQGKPDHPGISIAKAERRRLEKGPDVTRLTVWWKEPGNWRHNESYDPFETDQSKYSDKTVRDDFAWKLTSNQLFLIDPTNPPPGHAITNTENVMRRQIGAILDARIGESLRRYELRAAEINTDRWRVVLGDARSTMEYSGVVVRGHDSSIRFEVLTSRILTHEDPQFVGWSEEFADWRFVPSIRGWVAFTVTFNDANRRTIRFIDAKPLSAGEFDRVTEIPDVTHPDAVRGKLTVNRIFDYRPNVLAISNPRDPSWGIRKLPAAEASSSRAWIGWGVVAVCAAGLLVLRWRRRFS
jgi:hypothetical protein